MDKVLMLKISKKGVKGFCVCSVAKRKLDLMAVDEHRCWYVEGDFLVLRSY